MARPVTMVPMMARLIMSIASWKTSGYRIAVAGQPMRKLN